MKNMFIKKLLIAAILIGSVAPIVGSINANAAEDKKITGWYLKDDKWYFYNNNGELVKDKTIIEGDNNSKIGEDGAWVQSEEEKKALEERIAKDEAEHKIYKTKYPETNECSEEYKKRDDRWLNKDGNWYFSWKYEENEPVIKNDWDSINGFWYHFDKEGIMERNKTIKDNCDNDCVLNQDGALTNREEPDFGPLFPEGNIEYIRITEDGNDYYINKKRVKKIGWVLDEFDKKWYYTNSEGVVQKNTTIAGKDGKNYKLDANGAWIQ